MIPRLIQWQPVVAHDEVLLLPTGDVEPIVARHPIATLVPTRIDLHVSGVNIDGGSIDLGAGMPVVRLANAPLEELLAASRALAELVEPACFVVRDDGIVIELAGDVTVTPDDAWVVRIAHDDVDTACDALDTSDPGTLAIVQQLADALPDAYRPRAMLGSIWLARGKLDDARRELERAAEAEAPDHIRALAWSMLGRVLLELGESRRALAWLERATTAGHDEADRIRLGVAHAHAGNLPQAWAQLQPHHAGRALIEPAEALARMNRHGDARAFLRAALECEPKLLDPVPENQWPKPPDLTWATQPDQRALIAAAKGRRG